jgi:hypothetical protein
MAERRAAHDEDEGQEDQVRGLGAARADPDRDKKREEEEGAGEEPPRPSDPAILRVWSRLDGPYRLVHVATYRMGPPGRRRPVISRIEWCACTSAGRTSGTEWLTRDGTRRSRTG